MTIYECKPVTRGKRRPHFTDARGDFAMVQITSGDLKGRFALITWGSNIELKPGEDHSRWDWQVVHLPTSNYHERIINVSY